jgi:REP element-mobilizing transposase RayT
MVRAYHLIITAYGFWLPNDPRGSWSDFVGSWELLKFGPATKVSTRRSLARSPHDVPKLLAAKKALKYPPVAFTGIQARCVARGFAEYVTKTNLTVWACSILPEHVHLVIARHTYKVEQMANLLKGAATRRLIADNLHPLASHATPGKRPPRMWARGEWKVFLNSETEIRRAIRYVQEIPVKEGSGGSSGVL